MAISMTSTLCRAFAPALFTFAAAAVPTHAQQQNPNCARLETQLQTFDRSAGDPARADQIRRFEEAAGSQQAEIDRQQATSRRMGCESNSFFVLFSGQPAQCGPLNARIRQMQANLDRIHSDLARLQGAGSPERDGQRRAILVALAQNNCGPQYRAQVAAQPPPRGGGLFETLFGPGPSSVLSSPGGASPGWFTSGDTYRTLCVRTCDGYFWPISFATNQSRFAEDDRACRRSCPATETILFTHRNPGEDVGQAVSLSGQLYSTLPNAFKYRTAFDGACSCRQPGETWAHALRSVEDGTLEQGDIVVTEERARQMSQPRIDAQGRPIRPDPRGARPSPRAAQGGAQPSATPAPTAAPAAAANAEPAPAVKPDPNRTVREVGPTFMAR
jgi:hypothetical protein